MPDAHLEVEELAAMHREAHSPKAKRTRRKNTVDIEDSKYEAMVAARSEADSKITTLVAEVAEKDRKIETLEADASKAQGALEAEKKRADTAEEDKRVAAMRDDRINALGTGFVAALAKREVTNRNVKAQAASLTDEDWTARLEELEESLGLKRDAKLDDKPEEKNKEGEGGTTAKDKLPEGLFSKEAVASSRVGHTSEIVASEQEEPSLHARQGAMRGLIKPRKADKAKA